MKRLTLMGCALWCAVQLAWATAPYTHAGRSAAAEPAARVAEVESKLRGAGFTVLGHHVPKGLGGQASVVVSDPALLELIRATGPSSAVAASGIRVGVAADGALSYATPDYWARAYLRQGYTPAVQKAVQSVAQRLRQILGTGEGFGGDVPQDQLADYRYMFGMERFDSDNSLLVTLGSFDEAVKTVQSNLARGVRDTQSVYQLVLADKKMAVFGVAMNSASDGEGWWVNKIGADFPAALPYEIFIVDNKVYALYARYRIALAWPALGMGQFMGIINAPDAIRDTLLRVAGGTTP
ncbi:MAG: hypothetical protein Fur007_14210 [Rhodoferax sp.]